MVTRREFVIRFKNIARMVSETLIGNLGFFLTFLNLRCILLLGVISVINVNWLNIEDLLYI